MNQKKIDRINELARASKVRELTEEEKNEQKILRDEYRASFRLSLTSQLDNTVIVDPEGNRRSLRKN